MNYEAVDRGSEYKKLDVDPAWATLADDEKKAVNEPEFISRVVRPINAQKGNDLTVKDFAGIADGTWQQGTAAYEKRGVAAFVPEWLEENCIQCNKCAYVCPHASIRPFLIDENEMASAPFAEDKTLAAMGPALKGLRFMQAVRT